jgi:uncharacterized protein (TIGR03435 family)
VRHGDRCRSGLKLLALDKTSAGLKDWTAQKRGDKMQNRIVRNTLALGLVAGMLQSSRGQAQSPALPPQFEVASIKASGMLDGAHCGGDGPSPGRLTMRCATVQSLIQSAYGTFTNGPTFVPKQLQISGGPSWFNSEHYDVEAKTASNAPLDQMAGTMLQALLEDRFKLKLHRESREMPVYALTVAKGGLKVQPLKEACTPLNPMAITSPPAPGQRPPNFCGTPRMQMKGQTFVLDLHATSMTDLASRFSGSLDRAVLDNTGVAGIFDFHLEFVLDDTTPGLMFLRGRTPPSDNDPAGPSIFTAIQELGLRLEPTKGPVEFLVIDHIEKPAPN